MNRYHFDDLYRDALSGRVSRREVLRRAASLGLSMPVIAGLLAACGAGTEEETGTEGTSGEQAPTEVDTQTTPADTQTEVQSDGMEPKRGGVAKVGVPGDPGSIDPHVATTGQEQRLVAWHVYEGLFTTNASTEILPLLVEDFTVSTDRTVYTFKLRQGIKFHNGKEMTSEDVVASLQRFILHGGRMATMMKDVADTTSSEGWLNAPDSYTVEVTMTVPSVALMQSLSTIRQGAYIMPKEIAEKTGDERISEWQDYIGTGPFMMANWIPDQLVRLERFDDYQPRNETPNGYGGDRIPYLDAIEFIGIPDPTVRANELEVGTIHVLTNGPVSALDRLEEDPNLLFVKGSPSWYDHVYFNLRNGIFAMPDERALKLRQAVQAALDIEEITLAAYGDPAIFRLDPGLMWQETLWWTDACAEYYNQADPTKAKQLLEEAGYDGEPIRFRTSADRAELIAFTEVMAKQLQDVGFNIELVVMDMGSYTDSWFDFEGWELSALQSTFRDDPVLQAWTVSSDIFARPTEDQAPELFDQDYRLITEDDIDSRLAVFEEIQCSYYEQALHIRLADAFEVRVVSTELNDFEVTPEIFLWNVWMDE